MMRVICWWMRVCYNLKGLLCVCSGGNSRTAMIAALSPADINYEETLSTLRSDSAASCMFRPATRPRWGPFNPLMLGLMCLQVCWPRQTDPLQRRDQRRSQRQTDPRAEGWSGASEEPALLTGTSGAAGQLWYTHSTQNVYSLYCLYLVYADSSMYTRYSNSTGVLEHLKTCNISYLT